MGLIGASAISNRSGVMRSGKRILILLLTVALIAAISLYGIQTFTSLKRTVPVTSVALWDQFRLEVEVNKAEFGVGEPLEVKVSFDQYRKRNG